MGNQTPSLTIANGNMISEGSGACRYFIYTFTRPNGWTYEARERGCDDDSIPDEIHGWVTVTRHGKTISEIVCR